MSHPAALVQNNMEYQFLAVMILVFVTVWYTVLSNIISEQAHRYPFWALQGIASCESLGSSRHIQQHDTSIIDTTITFATNCCTNNGTWSGRMTETHGFICSNLYGDQCDVSVIERNNKNRSSLLVQLLISSNAMLLYGCCEIMSCAVLVLYYLRRHIIHAKIKAIVNVPASVRSHLYCAWFSTTSFWYRTLEQPLQGRWNCDGCRPTSRDRTYIV